jgi:flagellar basal body-associated protein FliL/DNA-directed RNA polymerase subunit RPC12/RpoP
MIRFECPSCKKTLRAVDDKAGTVSRCPACGKPCDVPIASSVEPSSKVAVIDYSKPAPLPRRKPMDDDEPILRRRKKKGTPVLLIATLAVLVVVAGGALAVVANRASKAERIASEARRTPPPPASVIIINRDRTQGQGFQPASFTPSGDTQDRVKERIASRENRYDEEELDRDLIKAIIILLVLTYIVATILLAVWVVKDCRNRSIENGVFWMLLTFGFSLIALMIYMASRPNGSLIRCEQCGNRRLSFVGVCPHCGRSIQSHGMAPI